MTDFFLDSTIAELDNDLNLDRSTDEQTSNGEIRLGRYEYPVAGEVNELQLARLQGKVTFGEYNKDSDPLTSSQVLSSFAGGMGNETLKEGVDDDTYWTSTLETRYPDGPTLLPYTESFIGTEADATVAFPLGDFGANYDTLFHVAFDEKVHTWDKSTQSFLYVADLPGNPVNLGVEFEGDFYIPLGSNGYAVMDIAGVVTPEAGFDILHFVLWDRKLAGITTTGVLVIQPPGGVMANASATVENVTVPTHHRPRRLVNFINQRGDPTLHIITDSVVYAYDPDGEVLYETRLNYPRHPDQGLGAENWRGDTMFVSVGTGIHGYNGSLVTSMGPDGRYGLPSNLRGKIVDLKGEYNALLALVQGTPDESQVAVDEEYVINPTMYRDRNTWAISNFPYRPVFSCVLRWSNSQWHPVWESESPAGFPTWMEVSQANDEYRLWWGYGARVYTQELPRAFQNPKQALRSGSQKFMPSGKLVTGWFDADMTAFTKLASHVEVNLEDVLDLNETGGVVRISYQFNNGKTWRLLGEANTVGLTILPFQNLLRDVGDPFSKGLAFRRIRFQVEYIQKVTTPVTVESAALDRKLSPLMSACVFKFHKLPESQLSWSFTVPLSEVTGYKNVGNDVLIRYLNHLLISEEFTEFGYRDTVYRVRMAQSMGKRSTGYDERGNYQVNLVEATLGEERDNTTVIKFVDMVA